MAKSAYPTQEYKKSRGLTIIELMIAVSVLAVLLAIGLPDLRSFIISNRLSSDVKGFVGLINYARSEAITRNQSVVICPKNADPAITCASSQFWGQFEVQAFIDTNGNGERNAGETLLKILPAVDPTGLERGFVRTATGIIVFRSIGMSTNTHSFDIWAVKSGDTAYEFKYGRTVCISRPGRVRVIPYSTTCTNF